MRGDGNILPFPTMTVQKRHLKGQDVAVVLVQPADAPPVRFKGTVWVRVGPRRAVASPQEERILAERRRHRDAPFDIYPLREADLGDLDENLFREAYLPAAVSPAVLAENNRTALRADGLAPPGGSRASARANRPRPAGHRQTAHPAPAHGVRLLRSRRGHRTGVGGHLAHEIQGPLPRLMSQIDELLRLHIMTRIDITSADTERQYPDYPLPALQQIVRNAVMHRSYEGTNAPVRLYWYADRVEIISPGGPFGLVTAENFGDPGINDYRNPHLAEAMRTLGYAQHFGVGIQIARDALARNGNPPPEFRVEPRTVIATIRRVASNKP